MFGSPTGVLLERGHRDSCRCVDRFTTLGLPCEGGHAFSARSRRGAVLVVCSCAILPPGVRESISMDDETLAASRFGPVASGVRPGVLPWSVPCSRSRNSSSESASYSDWRASIRDWWSTTRDSSSRRVCDSMRARTSSTNWLAGFGAYFVGPSTLTVRTRRTALDCAPGVRHWIAHPTHVHGQIPRTRSTRDCGRGTLGPVPGPRTRYSLVD